MTLETTTPGETPAAQTAAQASKPARKYSYSHKRLNAFDLWQEHVRKSAEAVTQVFLEVSDRASDRIS